MSYSTKYGKYPAPVREAALQVLESGGTMAEAQNAATIRMSLINGVPSPLVSHEAIRRWYAAKHGERPVLSPRGRINQANASTGERAARTDFVNHRAGRKAAPVRIPGKKKCRTCKTAASMGIRLVHTANCELWNAQYATKNDDWWRWFLRPLTERPQYIPPPD